MTDSGSGQTLAQIAAGLRKHRINAEQEYGSCFMLTFTDDRSVHWFLWIAEDLEPSEWDYDVETEITTDGFEWSLTFYVPEADLPRLARVLTEEVSLA